MKTSNMTQQLATTKKAKEKVIGFALDGVLRNIARSLDTVYRKCYPTRVIKQPVNAYNILDSYPFESQDEFANFLTTEAVTVFGRAEEATHGVVHEFNKVIAILKRNGYKPLLISKEVGKTKPATLFFLAFTGCEASDIRFVSKSEEFWDGVDILVTPNPEVIAMRPDRKRVIKLHKSYNRNVKHVRKINQIKELPKFLGIAEEKVTDAVLQPYNVMTFAGLVVNNESLTTVVNPNSQFIDEGVVVSNGEPLTEEEQGVLQRMQDKKSQDEAQS